MANVEQGPTAKFLVRNIHTMAELKLAGNCLKGSRPVLSFDKAFDDADKPHLALLKHLFAKVLSFGQYCVGQSLQAFVEVCSFPNGVFVQIFTTPNHHPRSQPFVDHVFTFSVTADERIWFRNYQIVNEQERRLEEIGQ